VSEELSTNDLLDQLVSEAVARVKADKKAAQHKKEQRLGGEPPTQPQALFTNPENWQRGQSIALIHEDTETLLGHFTEYLHKSVAGARRLVRDEASGIPPARVERVSGSWWLGTTRQPEPRQEWHTQRTVIIHAQLDRLRLHSPACELVAHLAYGGIERVELAVDTLFAGENADDLLTLAAGTNILGELSHACKVNIKTELAL